MKRLISILFVSFLAAPAFAEYALVYKSSTDVGKTIFVPALVTSEGVVVPAAGILAASDNLLGGFVDKDLQKASVVRFDNDLNLVLLRLGDKVDNKALQAAHKANSAKVSIFLPSATILASTAVVKSDAPLFKIQLSGNEAGAAPITLEKFNKKCDTTLEIVGQNITETAWRLEVDVTATPKMFFWKKTDEKGLNAIPKSTLHYSRQILLVPFHNGQVDSVPLELSGLKEENYELTVKITSKAGPFETKVPVRFVDKK